MGGHTWCSGAFISVQCLPVSLKENLHPVVHLKNTRDGRQQSGIHQAWMCIDIRDWKAASWLQGECFSQWPKSPPHPPKLFLNFVFLIINMIAFSLSVLLHSFRKGYFSLKISDQQFFSEPKLINIQAFSTQVIKVLHS